MKMLIQLYHNYVLRNYEHIYIVPVILRQQLQYIYYLSFLPVCQVTASQTYQDSSGFLLKSRVVQNNHIELTCSVCVYVIYLYILYIVIYCISYIILSYYYVRFV